MFFRRVVFILLVGCTTETETDSGVDDDAGSTFDASDEAVVEIGTGRDEYEPLVAGQMVDLTQGTQAGGGRYLGYHIWAGLQVRGFNPEDATIEVVLLDSSGGEQARQERILTLQPSGNGHVAYGFAPRIADCCALANNEVLMQVTIEDSTGKVGADERMVMAGPCIDRNTSQSFCP